VPDIRDAARISIVTASEALTGLNIRLSPNQRHSVSGEIVNSDAPRALPIDTFTLISEPDLTTGKLVIHNTAADRSRRFKMEGIAAGIYNVEATAIDGTTTFLGHARLDLSSRDTPEEVTDLKIILRSSVDIDGRIIMADSGKEIDWTQIHIGAVCDTTASNFIIPRWNASMSANGSFRLAQMPNSDCALLVSHIPDKGYVISATLDGVDVLHNTFSPAARLLRDSSSQSRWPGPRSGKKPGRRGIPVACAGPADSQSTVRNEPVRSGSRGSGFH
jgi:hypothetical protein